MEYSLSKNIKFESWEELREFIIKTFTSIDEIKNVINTSETITKWDILFAFQKLQYYAPLFVKSKTHTCFKNFIESDLFSAEELYETFVSNEEDLTESITKEKLKVIADKINRKKHWHDIKDFAELENYVNRFMSKENDYVECLDYFEKHNDEHYAKLLELKPVLFFIKLYSEEQLLEANEILSSYLNKHLDDYFSKLPSSINDTSSYADIIIDKRNAILKHCMLAPENAMITLKKLIASRIVNLKSFKGKYTIEQLNALPNDVKSALKNPENIWKLHTSAQHICYSIPNGKEWQVIEYFAVKDPEMARNIINCYMHSSLFKMSRKIVIDHYKDVDPEKIPPFIKEYIAESIRLQESQVENGKQNADWRKTENDIRKLHWLNGRDELIQYFKLEDGIPIGSKAEYYRIAYFFKDSGLSAQGFCNKYQIKDVEGFREMLRRVADEDSEFGKFYEEFSAKKQKDHLSSCRENILSIATNPQSISEVIENSGSSKNLANLVKISDYLTDDPQMAESLIENVIRYYHSRLNSYDMASFELEEVNKMLTFKEIMFIIEPEVLEKINNNSSVDITREFMKAFGDYRDKLSPELRKLLNASNNSIRARLKPYSSAFVRQSYASHDTQVPDSNGELVTITDDMIDMAMCYAHEHKLFRTAMVMNKIIRAVADGRIQNQAETEEYKNQLKERILQKMTCVKQLNSVILSRQKPSQPLDE